MTIEKKNLKIRNKIADFKDVIRIIKKIVLTFEKLLYKLSQCTLSQCYQHDFIIITNITQLREMKKTHSHISIFKIQSYLYFIS